MQTKFSALTMSTKNSKTKNMLKYNYLTSPYSMITVSYAGSPSVQETLGIFALGCYRPIPLMSSDQ